ncbi:MAG: ribonuclease P protein component [Chloroherpetonaceae bacterium]|nr:ribonuclease P protein component [Chloroherpetonaceae bacterium]MDW8438370.1 ribonuclease P protein component [Chloroherpetonaceae bacterium]
MRARATLKKREILRLKKDIDALFGEGKSVKALPLKVLYQVVPLDEPSKTNAPAVMAMFVVSKRSVKKAAHRNRVKRLMREAYRLLKSEIAEAFAQKQTLNRQLRLALLYQSSSKDASLDELKSALSEATRKIIERLEL